jgi:hypothetical protein
MNAYATMDDYIVRTIWVAVFIGSIYSTWLAGRIAQRRGRSFKAWMWIAGLLIGPLALPLLFLLPNLDRKDPEDPKGERRGKACNPKQSGPGPPRHVFGRRRNLTTRTDMLRFTRLTNLFPASPGAMAAQTGALPNIG